MTSPQPFVAVVTPAQKQLLDAFMFDGADPDVIADRMGKSRGTIYNRFRRILNASGYPNRTALALAIERGEIRLRVHDGRADQ